MLPPVGRSERQCSDLKLKREHIQWSRLIIKSSKTLGILSYVFGMVARLTILTGIERDEIDQ